MVPVSRPDGHLNLNYIPVSQPMSGTSTGSNSPNDLTANTAKPPFGATNALGSAPGSLGSTRIGAGSPSHELGTRLFSKRYAFIIGLTCRSFIANYLFFVFGVAGLGRFKRKKAFHQAFGALLQVAILLLCAKTYPSLLVRMDSPTSCLFQRRLSIVLAAGHALAQSLQDFLPLAH
jgi:hypothetical protein